MVAAVFGNRIKMDVSGTPGTGAITLNAAITSHVTFAGGGITDSDVVSYLLTDGEEWEIGTGTYTAAGTSLSRDTIHGSSNAGSAISATSSTIVAVIVSAEDLAGFTKTTDFTDIDVFTLVVPANTTISDFAKTILDDTTAAGVRSTIGAGTGDGSVTSVSGSGGSSGLTLTGGPITGSGTLTIAGTLDVDNGGTGQTSYTNGQLLIGNTTGNTLAKATLTAGQGISITNGAGSITAETLNPLAIKSADFTLGATENLIINNKSTGTLTITMSAVGLPYGRLLYINNTRATAAISSASNIIAQIDISGPGTAILPATDGAWAILVSYPNSWKIIASG